MECRRRARAPSISTSCSTATSRLPSPGSRCRTRACTSARSCWSRWRRWRRGSRSRATGPWRLWSQSYTEAGMSHLDDLDEYEAELELRLKKEYQAVFGLFRYCVLTPDATYLCNKLERTYAPQPAYPFIRLQLEDVWVWDKNRPTRMIPRTEILITSGDVTVEELRVEGDEPTLTPEALNERIGDIRPRDDDA